MHMVLMDLQEREPSPGAYTERMEPRAELLGTGADERAPCKEWVVRDLDEGVRRRAHST